MRGSISYHSIDGHVIVVQRHAGRAGVAVDRIVQVRVGRNGTFTGETEGGRERCTHKPEMLISSIPDETQWNK